MSGDRRLGIEIQSRETGASDATTRIAQGLERITVAGDKTGATFARLGPAAQEAIRAALGLSASLTGVTAAAGPAANSIERLATSTRVFSTAAVPLKIGGFAGELRDLGRASEEAGRGFERAATHIYPITDTLLRGNIRQAMSSIGATMRDLSLGSVALGASFGGFMAVMGTVATARWAADMGRLAESTQAGAMAAGMSVSDYSSLRGAFELMGLKGNEADTSLRQFARTLSEAAADPSSKAARAFEALGFSESQVASMSQNSMGALLAVSQALSGFANDANKAAIMSDLFGRGAERIGPAIDKGADSLRGLITEAKKLGVVLGDEDVQAMEKTGNKIHELGTAVEGSGIATFRAWEPVIDGVVTALERVVVAAGNAASAIKSAASGAADAIPVFAGMKTAYELMRGVVGGGEETGSERSGFGKIPPLLSHVGPLDTATEMGRIQERIAEARDKAAAATPATKVGARELSQNEARAAIGVLQNALSQANLSSRDRLHLQAELANQERALRTGQIHEGAAGERAGANAERQSYEAWVANQRNRISESRGNFQQQIALVQEWEQRAKASTTNVAEQQKRIAAAEKEAITIRREQTQQEIQELQERSSATQRHASLTERGQDIQTRSRQILGLETPAQAAQARIAAATQERDAVVAAYTAELTAATAAGPSQIAAADRARDAIISANQEWADKVLQSYEQLDQAAKKAADAMEKPFKDAFDSIGEGITGLGSDLLKLEPSRHASRLQRSFDSTINRTTGGLFKDVGELASQGITSLLPDSQAGQGLGDYLSKQLGSLLGISSQATQVSLLTTIAFNTGVMAGTATTSTAASGVSAAGAVGGIGGIFSFVKGIFGFSHGGIVPSAQGGMITPRATLALLHPQEMVLPANISRTIQGLAAGTGNASINSPMYNTVNVKRPFETRSDFDSMMDAGRGAFDQMLRGRLMQAGYRVPG